MRRCILVSGAFAAMLASATAQDAGMGTPVITPPILNQPAESTQQLLVPPTQTNPAPLQAPPPEPPAVPATAQTPAAPSAPAQASPQQAAPASGDQPEQTVSRTVATETFGQWTRECFEPEFDDGSCQIVHRVTSGNASQVVLVMALAAASDSGPAAIQMALPLGISLPAGIRVLVGSGYQNQIPLQRCTPQGCIVEGTASDDLLAAMKRENSGAVVVENEQGQRIELPFSLQGFTAAYASMVND